MFISEKDAFELAEQYGTPLYVYSEEILERSALTMANLLPDKRFKASYSVKANSNISLLKIIRRCGLHADAMSPGEIISIIEAGYAPEDIFYIANNVSAEEMKFAIDKGCLVSVDSIAQLETFCELAPGGRCSVRINSGKGVGHSDKVITAGKRTKFGVVVEDIPEAIEVARRAGVKICGVNHHLGSLFLEPSGYIEGAKNLTAAALLFPELEFVDFGGGFGVPYRERESGLDFELTASLLNEVCDDFVEKYHNKDIVFKAEPGRFVVAESGILLGGVHSVKCNHGVTYVGTDLGFNVLIRPAMYDSYHKIDVLSRSGSKEKITATIVGNICETCDVLGRDRELTRPEIGDIAVAHTAGAYAYSMASNYNCRLRPAEVLITKSGECKLIRRRDSYDDILANQRGLYFSEGSEADVSFKKLAAEKV